MTGGRYGDNTLALPRSLQRGDLRAAGIGKSLSFSNAG